MSAKLRRQNRIKEILHDYNISNQEDLVNKLKEEGVVVTQATLSRDFAELGVIRTIAGNGIRYILNPEESGKQIARLGIAEEMASSGASGSRRAGRGPRRRRAATSTTDTLFAEDDVLRHREGVHQLVVVPLAVELN